METTIHFEDRSRALDLQWSEDIESMTFSEAPEELREFTASTTGAVGVQAMAHGEDCSEQYFADEPVMRFDVERPITDMQLAIASPDDLGVMVCSRIVKA